MRKVIFSMTMTLDGFFCGPNGELDWMSQVPDKELNNDSVAFYDGIEGGLIGYPTGVGMIAYWSSVAGNASAPEAEKAIAKSVNKLHAILVSDRDEKPASAAAELLIAHSDDELIAAVTKIKQHSGRDLALSGGIRTAQKFVRLGLVDEDELPARAKDAINNGVVAE